MRAHPLLTVDIIIELERNGVVLIERKNAPLGWAIPGGFVDEGETLEDAAIREAFEETCLNVSLKTQFHAYSDPLRDQRGHTITVVFIAEAKGVPKAKDDAKAIGVFKEGSLPQPLTFDHGNILSDYFRWKKEGFKVFEGR
ncbi:MAG: NUDIX hydrolase [Deltaproteobacteria bacterium]|nr:NUDIX hydrolase [Deltaproteobacteria bacterium]